MTHIDSREMNDWIVEHSEQVSVSSSIKCPCSPDEDPNRAFLTCAVCGGYGRFYRAPVEMWGIITDAQFNKQLLETGIAQPGDLLFSPVYNGNAPTLHNFDKVVLEWPDGLPYDGDLITRSFLGYDILMYAPIVVSQCVSVDPQVGTVTDYVLGADFTLSGRQLTWLPGRGPLPGGTYAIKYTAQYEWLCFIPPKPRYENNESLGQRVLLRARHLVPARISE